MKIVLLASALAISAGVSAEVYKPAPDEVKAITQKVADWQIETFEDSGRDRALSSRRRKKAEAAGTVLKKYHDLTWHMGALYAGMMEWSLISGDPKYADWLTMIGERNAWKLQERPYHADDHTVGQFYLKLYEQTGDKVMLEPTQQRFDWILANPKTGTLEWKVKPTDAHNRWGWCDALFMAPPVWARLAKVTGDQKYLDFMDQEYHATCDLLWSADDNLFFRDSSFFSRREKNGENVFWARGNGWVFGGLALMIPDLPEDWAERSFYVDLFKTMATKLAAIQREDGTWSMGLLGGVEGYPIKETSGTSFYTFGLAWGINNGLLDRAAYEPVVLKAWQALTDCVTDEGLLGYVQPVGAAPGDSYADKTEVYGIGAFLAAGTEVYKMVGGTVAEVKKQIDAKGITFMKDAGWCWYQDPRAIIHDSKLIVGGVSGQNGAVKVGVYDLKESKDLGTVVLHEKLQRDDHDAPAFYARPDGSLLAVWAKHANQPIHYYNISEPGDFLKWGDTRKFMHDYSPKGVTYMNLYTMKDEGRLYCFFRDGPNFNPAFITSSDDGETWGGYTHFITHDVGGRQRPYARYLQRDENTIGTSFTDAHPRNFGNSLYYADFRDGAFYRADGTKIKDLADGPLITSEAEKVYAGSEEHRKGRHGGSATNSAWSCATGMDDARNPHLGYTVYFTNDDHRFRIASWTGTEWNDREIAYAGKCLYTKESSYTGLMAFDPENPQRVYISTDVDPSTGKDSGGVHEIYTALVGADDDVSTIQWEAVTSGSKYKNIRPIVVAGDGYKVLTWLGNGPWSHFRDYATDAVGIILERP